MIRFLKYHGIGNDFVLIDNRDMAAPTDPEFVRHICDRHLGVGADGVLYVMPGDDITMKVMNADGSEAEMCGNGIRCVARYVFENGLVKKKKFIIRTLGGDMKAEVFPGDPFMVEVDMGTPVLDGRDIPMDHDGRFISRPIDIGGMSIRGTGVSMGNPHFVTFDDLDDEKIDVLGPLFAVSPMFPKGINTEFAKVTDGEIRLRVYERGAAWTLACGTGACATTVAAALNGMVPFNEPIDVRLPGGWLSITVDKDMKYVLMRGPAELVFEGILV